MAANPTGDEWLCVEIVNGLAEEALRGRSLQDMSTTPSGLSKDRSIHVDPL